MPYHFYIMAVMYILAGFIHFIKPKIYLGIMPAYIPAKKTMVFLSGVVEVVLGAALFFEETRALAIWGIIAMLAVFMTVHIDMLTNKKLKGRIPMWLIWLRIPMQFGLMYWAYFYL